MSDVDTRVEVDSEQKPETVADEAIKGLPRWDHARLNREGQPIRVFYRPLPRIVETLDSAEVMEHTRWGLIAVVQAPDLPGELEGAPVAQVERKIRLHFPDLGDREYETLQRLPRYLKGIAGDMDVNESTVRSNLVTARKKLDHDPGSTAELVRWGMLEGWIPAPPLTTEEEHRLGSLRARQRDVAARSHLKYKEIAEDLGVGLSTVKAHLHNIYSATECEGKIELIGLVTRAVLNERGGWCQEATPRARSVEG